LANPGTPPPRGGDEEASAGRHGIACVDDEVQEDLLDLAGVGLHERGGGIEAQVEVDVLAEGPCEEQLLFADQRVEVQHGGQDELAAAEGQ